MQVGMIGLGRMGMNMARRLLRGGHEVAAYNRTPQKTRELELEGGLGAYSLEELRGQLVSPRVLWLMLPAGEIVDAHLSELRPLLSAGDIIVDGANSDYRDTVRRARTMSEAGLQFLDAGVSGGIWGLSEGYCLMLGGPEGAFRAVEPALKSLAPSDGYMYCGPSGAGHFTKMIHNGIEYGLMQAYGEGFALLKASPYGQSLDLAQLAHVWNHGSVVRSWLLELAEEVFAKDPDLAGLAAYVEDSGEGRWTVREAVDLGVSAPVITMSLMERFRSRDRNSFADRVLAALRHEFGGHQVTDAKNR